MYRRAGPGLSTDSAPISGRGRLVRDADGHRPFRGHTNADVLAAVIKRNRSQCHTAGHPGRDCAMLSKDRVTVGPGLACDGRSTSRCGASQIPRHHAPVALLPWAAALRRGSLRCPVVQPRAREPVLRLEIQRPRERRLTRRSRPMALSPDGSRLAFLATGTDGNEIVARSLDSVRSRLPKPRMLHLFGHLIAAGCLQREWLTAK